MRQERQELIWLKKERTKDYASVQLGRADKGDQNGAAREGEENQKTAVS